MNNNINCNVNSNYTHRHSEFFCLFETIFLFVLFCSGFFFSSISAASPLSSSRSSGSPQPLLEFDKTLPVDIQSDSAHFDEKTGETLYEGNVTVTQAGHELRSDTLTIHRTREGKIDHIIATGNPAYFVTRKKIEKKEHADFGNISANTPIVIAGDSPTDNPADSPADSPADIRGQANTIHYYPSDAKIVLLKNAEISQNEQLIRGGNLIYFLETRVLISESSRDSKTIVILKPKESKQNSTSQKSSLQNSTLEHSTVKRKP